MNKLTVIDLFCGAGGLSKGFIDAGFRVLAGIDNDIKALETFELNHGGAVSINADLSNNNFLKELKKVVGKQNVDVIVGGPPCQGFSLTGPRNMNDPRNKLYKSMIEAVSFFKPKAFIVENVTGLARLYGGEVRKDIEKSFEKLGYSVKSEILTACDYGVPQVRKRIFFVGVRKELGEFNFPKPTHNENNYVGCKDAMGDLPDLIKDMGSNESSYTKKPFSDYQKKMRKNSKILYNHVGTSHAPHVISTISLVPEGGNHKDLPEGVGDSRKFNEAWTRYHSMKPSRTIDTGHRNHFHYKYNRVPTVRENARLQSFPDNFVFLGTKTQQNRQVGNAVPPLLAYNLAKEIKKIIK